MNDNMPEHVDLTFSKVDDTFLDRLAQYIDQMKDQRERYILNWTGRGGAFVEAGKPLDPAKTLRPDAKNSVNFDTTKNLFITGDNLEALKLLQESYLGKVDMIYIDPPYNTGKDFVYHDNFTASTTEQIDETRDDDGNRQFSVNTKENGRYHSDWLSMMYPRLILARNFLSDKGVIFISIDDNEQANLKLLCDSVFGSDNLLGQIVWMKKNAQNDAESIQKNHEYILCYRKINAVLSDSGIYTKAVYKDDDGTYYYRGASLTTGGAGGTLNNRPRLGYSIYVNDDTGDFIGVCDYNVELARTSNDLSAVYNDRQDLLDRGYRIIRPPKRGAGLGCWTWALDKFNRDKDEIGISGNSVYKKVRVAPDSVYENAGRLFADISNYRPFNSVIDDVSSAQGTNEVGRLFGSKIFDHPKSIKLISRFLAQFKDSIVLDFFAGSGTTAQAVMQQNAKDGGHRQFILVQLPEQCNEKSEAYKAGYKTIDELSRERIRRAAKKIAAEDKNADSHDYGFRAMYIDYANENDGIEQTVSQTNQTDILNMANNIREGRTPLDLLFGVLLQKGWNMDGQLTRLDINGNEVLTYDHIDGAPGTGVVACFDRDINSDTVQQIIDMAPQAAVFRDSSFKSSSDKINLVERFRTGNSGGVTTGVWVI